MLHLIKALIDDVLEELCSRLRRGAEAQPVCFCGFGRALREAAICNQRVAGLSSQSGRGRAEGFFNES